MRVPRINATVSKIDILFNCCIYRKVYFQPLNGVAEKHVEFANRKRRLFYVRYHVPIQHSPKLTLCSTTEF